MKVAILADIHANIAALERVLDDVRREGIDRLVLLGDYVGYYYEPRAVVEALAAFECIGIQGNHDRMALEARDDLARLSRYREHYGSGLDAVFEQFGKAEWEWLASHRVSREIDLGGHTILLAHGSPQEPDAYLYPDAPQARFAGLAGQFAGDAIWLGHTHWPFVRPGQPSILNPGSVGQPRDIGGLASWAVFHVDTGSVAFRRTEFDAAPLAAHCRRRDPALATLGKSLSRRRLGEPA